MNIRMVSAYWHNDQIDGVGLTREYDDDGSGNAFAEGCERALPIFDMRPPEQGIAWLDQVTRGRPRLSAATADLVIATIHWLERRHYIVSDNFNGVLWVATRAGEIVVIQHDENIDPIRRLFRDARFEALSHDKFEQAIREILHTPASQ